MPSIIFERENLTGRVPDNEHAFRATLHKLGDLPIVGDVRGDGSFCGIELVKDKTTKETFTDEESERVLHGFLSGARTTTASTAAPTTAATPSSSSPRPSSPTSPLRRDRTDSARRPHQNVDQAQTAVAVVAARPWPGRRYQGRAAIEGGRDRLKRG
ncbi:hypothetical protein OIE51_06935 [Streptomyces sp. NBC_01803]|nr:hypothetical protein OIE51_06935 [Streptomyces sp. NBC_01803]